MDTTIVKQIDILLSKHLKGFAKKTDLDKFTTKADLKEFATKKDLKDTLNDYPTKQDLNIALKGFATKKDLKYEIDDAIADIVHAVEAGKADKESLKELESRVKTIEDQVNVSTH